MSKKCLNCGADLADEASFCPHCAHSQTEKVAVMPPKPWKKRALLASVAVVILIMAALGIYRIVSPETYEGGSEVIYIDNGLTYHVLLSLQGGTGIQREAQSEVTVTLPSGGNASFPSRLYIYAENSNADVTETFMGKVKSYSVETLPEDNAEKMNFTAPEYSESFPDAALTSNVQYRAESGTNEVLWTLHMKNGDTICLRQKIHATLQLSVSYYPENVPMDTIADLQVLLDTIDAEVDPNTVVNLYLPPVTYDGGIAMKNRTYTLYGSSNEDSMTTFTGTVSIETRQPQLPELYGIHFAGDGGIGLSAREGVTLYECVFTGWDIGAIAWNGSWVAARRCTFDGNQVGLQFESNSASFSSPSYHDNTFLNNETAIEITKLPGTAVLTFSGSVFSGNGTDVKNTANHPIDLSGATIE